jgi:putative NIF3 family GTP cyclohydrolase 1 type 2
MFADIGHFESEQFAKEIFFDVLNKKFTNFAVCFSNVKTNPINYF